MTQCRAIRSRSMKAWPRESPAMAGLNRLKPQCCSRTNQASTSGCGKHTHTRREWRGGNRGAKQHTSGQPFELHSRGLISSNKAFQAVPVQHSGPEIVQPITSPNRRSMDPVHQSKLSTKKTQKRTTQENAITIRNKVTSTPTPATTAKEPSEATPNTHPSAHPSQTSNLPQPADKPLPSVGWLGPWAVVG